MAANEAVDALQNELGSLTCQEEQKPSQFKKLPPSVFIALAQRYLDAAQRVVLAASEKYARETLVTTGEHAPTVWRVTLLSQADAVRMLSTVPPRAYAPLRWTNELVLLDSNTRGFSRTTLTRYWQGLSLFIDNAPALSVVRIRKAWRLSSLVFAAVARRPAMRLEVASTLTPQQVDDLGVDADVLAREGRLLCSNLASNNRRLSDPNPWPSDDSAWLRLWNQPALVELDLSGTPLVELPDALVPLRTLRVLRANYMPQLQEVAVLARGPPMLEILTLSGNKTLSSLPATYACASSLVRLELDDGTLDDMGSRSGHPGGWDFIKDLPNLRRLKFYYQKYEHTRHIDVVASHPCFAPSVLEFAGFGLGRHVYRNLRAHILDAVPSMTPPQVRDLELAAASMEQDARLNGYGDSKEVMEAYLVDLRALMAGKPRPSPAVVVESLAPPLGFHKEREYTPCVHQTFVENVYHSISMMPAHRGKSFEELRLEDYQRADADPDHPLAAASHHWRVAAMKRDALAAANAAFAAVAAERDRLTVERDGLAAAAAGRLAFRAPSPVVEVSPVKPFVFGASAAEERVVTPETHSDKPFAFGANASGQEEPFVFGARK